ncbi:MAG: sulfotransferase [Phycisphaerales bacterium]|nr:sulfotransferase [Phycisphaerales bacterium]
MNAPAPDRLDDPFFIVGAPRSGTTLVQAIISSHSRMHVPAETEFFMKFIPPDAATQDESTWQAYVERWLGSMPFQEQGLDATAFRERLQTIDRTTRGVFLALLAEHARATGKPRIGEKSPHHCRHIDAMLMALPEVKIIHVYRDPRDVVASRLRVPWTHASHRHLANSWRKDLERHLRCLSSLPNDRYMGLQLEALILQPEEETRCLCSFLGETYEPGMLAFHERKDAGFTDREAAWKSGTRKPLDPNAIGRYRETLSNRQVHDIQVIAGPLMEQLGYAHDSIRPGLLWPMLGMLDAVRDRAHRLRHSVRKRL